MGFAEPMNGEGLSFADVVKTNPNAPENQNGDVVPIGPWPGIDAVKARISVDSEVDAMELDPSCAVVDSASL